jgi:hypothetical protein
MQVDKAYLDNCAGPYKTIEQCREHALYTWGAWYSSVIYPVDKTFYVNDGVDGQTGQFWETLPECAYFVVERNKENLEDFD